MDAVTGHDGVTSNRSVRQLEERVRELERQNPRGRYTQGAFGQGRGIKGTLLERSTLKNGFQ